MATNFSPCKGSYVLNQFPSNVMFGMNGFHVSASGAIQGHHGSLVYFFQSFQTQIPAIPTPSSMPTSRLNPFPNDKFWTLPN